MTEKKDTFFLKSIKGVTPIKKNNKIKKGIKETPNVFVNKKNKKTNDLISQTKKDKKNRITKNFFLEPMNTNKMLKKGQIKINKKIDLHGKNLLESEKEFKQTVLECYKNQKRCILFVTGKGLYKQYHNNPNNNPKLFYGKIREAFLKWVNQKEYAKYILSVNRASNEHGGDGAFFVYLRKKSNL